MWLQAIEIYHGDVRTPGQLPGYVTEIHGIVERADVLDPGACHVGPRRGGWIT